MRYFRSAVILTLAFGLAITSCAWAVPKSNKVKHTAKVKERKAKSYHGVYSSGEHQAHNAVKQHKAMHKHAHKAALDVRRTHAAPHTMNVAATIPPVPMRNGHLLMPPPLVGSLASLERQNERDNAEGLTRIEDDAQLNQMRREGELVPLPVGATLRANPELPMNRRYTRPWTAKFLADTAHAHYVRFHRSLEVNSAVRTVAYQRYLMRVNGNAAPAEGETASPHETGATIDITKKGLSLSEIAWMRAYLLPLEAAGKIDVEEEFYQSCFHITVYKSYMPAARPVRHSSTALLASRMR
jgi:Family of unknown function (DUF5715)